MKISVYKISYKISTGLKTLCISLDKIDGFITSPYRKIKHLVLSDYGLLDKICDKIEYFISKSSAITNSVNYNFGKIRIDHIILYLSKIY